jgi:hypothetical protein
MYNDPKAVDKIVNRCLASIRAGYYQDSNRAKRKLNYTTESLEHYCDEYGDYYFNLVEDGVVYSSASETCKTLIQSYCDKGQILEALILDEICYQDCFTNGKLAKRKIIKDLHNINQNYLNYFTTTYGVSRDQVVRVASTLKHFSNARLNRQVDKLISQLKGEEDLIESLCY